MPKTRGSVRVARSEEARVVGRRLAAAREAAGLSQEAAAKRLGVPQSTIGKLELGQRQLRFVEGIRLAAAYDADPSSFYPEASE